MPPEPARTLSASPAPQSVPEGNALRELLRAVLAHPLLVALVTLAALIGSLAYMLAREPAYEATAELLVSPLPLGDELVGLGLLPESSEPTRIVQTAAGLVRSTRVAAATARQLGGDWTTQAVLDAISVEPRGESNLLAVTGVSQDPETAARLATSFARIALEVRRARVAAAIDGRLVQLEAQQAEFRRQFGRGSEELALQIQRLQSVRGSDPTLSLSAAADVPATAAGLPAAVLVGIAVLLGLGLGVAAAVLADRLDPRVRGEDELVELLDLPVVARISKTSRPFHAAQAIEAFRTLVSQLEQGVGKGAIVLTSASSGDGKTTSAVNLGRALAETVDGVIFLDLDVSRSELPFHLGLSPDEGSDLMKANGQLLDALRPVPGLSGAFAAHFGSFAADPTVGLTPTFPRLLDEARELADWVVVDTPPLGEVGGGLRAVARADVILVVVRTGHTRRGSLKVMREVMAGIEKQPYGIILLGEGPGSRSEYYLGGAVDGAGGLPLWTRRVRAAAERWRA